MLNSIIDNFSDMYYPDKFLSECIELYPSNENVFLQNDFDKGTKHFLSLATINLNLINEEWDENIHFVVPIEPYEGVIGEYTKQYHNYYVRENWIAFQVVDGKYEFLADYKYFLIENNEHDKKLLNQIRKYRNIEFSVIKNSLTKFYENQHKCFDTAKARFEEKKSKNLKYNHKLYSKHFTLLGGVPYEGNWVATKFPIKNIHVPYHGYDEKIPYPLTKDKKIFYFIGDINPNTFVSGIKCQKFPGGVLLFYEPVNQIALLTFEWT